MDKVSFDIVNKDLTQKREDALLKIKNSHLFDEFIKKYGLKGSSSINRAISALINKEYVYRYAEGYQVYDRFMQLWLVTLP